MNIRNIKFIYGKIYKKLKTPRVGTADSQKLVRWEFIFYLILNNSSMNKSNSKKSINYENNVQKIIDDYK